MELLDSPMQKEDYIQDLLHQEKVQSLLSKLDDFGPITTVDNRTLNAIHKGAGLEGYAAKLLEYGLTKDIAPFHKRMMTFRQYVHNKWVEAAKTSQAGQDVRNNWAMFIAKLLSSYLVQAGYRHPDLVAFVERRTEALYRNAREKNFDVYYSQSELQKMPTRPPNWRNTPVLRAEYDPGGNEKPMPNIWDIYTLAFFPDDCKSVMLQEQIRAIIAYVLDERFQALPWGYGLLFFNENRRYYACGWSPRLPGLHGFDDPLDQGTLLLYTDLMSHFEEARKSAWFRRCLEHLETFKTETGTYCFPKNYIQEKKDQGFVCGASMGLGEDRRRKIALEIESTFRMLLIKKRITM
jgi:hypothetical protein